MGYQVMQPLSGCASPQRQAPHSQFGYLKGLKGSIFTSRQPGWSLKAATVGHGMGSHSCQTGGLPLLMDMNDCPSHAPQTQHFSYLARVPRTEEGSLKITQIMDGNIANWASEPI